jgi:hypothetical protein
MSIAELLCASLKTGENVKAVYVLARVPAEVELHLNSLLAKSFAMMPQC